ncbi:MAG: NAD(P)/FAD-dependent oxidoreductase [Candidatus Levyibacteriota bacterium]
MKIAIIGAGLTGLTLAYKLSKKGFYVSVFEKDEIPGGLAKGFKSENWQWYLDNYYHHIFTSDSSIINLAKEVNIPIGFLRPKTKSLIDGKIYPLDSPLDVLSFKELTVLERLRMGLILAYLKITPFWKSMENVAAADFLPKMMGEKSYKILWEPLLSAKFGQYKNHVPLSWFWARIKKRSASLGYPQGGFQNLINEIKNKAQKNGVKFYFESEVTKISKNREEINLSFANSKKETFNKLIATIPSPSFTKLIDDLPKDYIKKLNSLKYISALNLILVLNKPFFQDNTYWLNVCDKSFPFLSVVEHTNFIDSKYYNGEHIIYVGNYLPQNHPYFSKSADELLAIFDPFLKRINQNYKSQVINYKLIKDYFAQPVIPLNYSKIIPSFKTPLKNVYLTNMQQVYPWDRGTNYAVEFGEKVASLVAYETF